MEESFNSLSEEDVVVGRAMCGGNGDVDVDSARWSEDGQEGMTCEECEDVLWENDDAVLWVVLHGEVVRSEVDIWECSDVGWSRHGITFGGCVQWGVGLSERECPTHRHASRDGG